MSNQSGDTDIVVLYIGGRPRSGSTLLGTILNEVPGFFCTGEISFIWENGFALNRPCGCGVPFKECPLWSEISGRAFGGVDVVDASRMMSERKGAPKNRDLILELLRSHIQGGGSSTYRRYLSVLESLYTAVARVSGSDVIVDTSKVPWHAFLLTQIPSLDLKVVHLIRDPRGTTYSWQKNVKRSDVTEGDVVKMKTHGPALESKRWMYWNVLFEMMGSTTLADYLRVRYEDFVASPRDELQKIGKAIGVRIPKMVDDSDVHLGTNHTVWGNPKRMKTGRVRLRLDDDWSDHLDLWKRKKVELLTWPLLLRYGYMG